MNKLKLRRTMNVIPIYTYFSKRMNSLVLRGMQVFIGGIRKKIL
jgi:hypothetical protein